MKWYVYNKSTKHVDFDGTLDAADITEAIGLLSSYYPKLLNCG